MDVAPSGDLGVAPQLREPLAGGQKPVFENRRRPEAPSPERRVDPLADLGLADASVLLRRTQQFHRLAVHLTSLGKAAAARHGIGPHEFDNIVATRITSVEPRRVEELVGKLSKLI